MTINNHSNYAVSSAKGISVHKCHIYGKEISVPIKTDEVLES